MRIVRFRVWKRHQWTYADRDHANHARSSNAFPCTLIPTSVSVITYGVGRDTFKITNITRLRTLHITILMDEDADTDHAIRAHGNAPLLP